jgi:hypothetical protein
MRLSTCSLAALLAFSSPAAAQVTFFTSKAPLEAAAGTITLLESFGEVAPRDTPLPSFTIGGVLYTGLAGVPFPNVLVASAGYDNFGAGCPHPTTEAILTANGDEDFRVDLAAPARAIGFEVYLNGDGPATAGFYSGDTLLDSYTFPAAADDLEYLGVLSATPITAIRWTGPVGETLNSGISEIGVCASGCCKAPVSCLSESASCGVISNQCGGTIDCGTCASGQSCGGPDGPNACVCTGASCDPGVTFYPSKPSFDAVARSTLIEDFENIWPRNAALASVTSNGIVYTGLGGRQIGTNLPFGNVLVAAPGYDNFGAGVAQPTGTSILTANGTEDFRLDFATAVLTVGFDTYLNGEGSVAVSVFNGSALLSSFVYPGAANDQEYLGIVSQTPITSLRFTAAVGETLNAGIDNVSTCTSDCCVPTTCAAQGALCGSISNGCGGALDCGGCTAPQICGGGGTPNVCGSSGPPACAQPCGKGKVLVDHLPPGDPSNHHLMCLSPEAVPAHLAHGDRCGP